MGTFFKLFFSLALITSLLVTGCNDPATDETNNGSGSVDTTKPVIQFVNPTSNQYVSGTINVVGVVTDESQISSIELKLDNGSFETITPGPYWIYSLATQSLGEGMHTLTAHATDEKGYLSDDTIVTFYTDQNVPSVNITSPSHGTIVKGLIDISGTASDANGVSSVYLIAANNLPGNVADGTDSWELLDFDTTNLTDGDVILTAMAYDNADLAGVHNILVIVDNTSPVVAVTSHTDGQAFTGNITLSGTVNDNIDLSRVEVSINSGSLVPAFVPENELSWSYDLSVASLSEGLQTLAIYATDEAGNVGTITIYMYYDTTPPTVNISTPAAVTYFKDNGNNIVGTYTNSTSLQVKVSVLRSDNGQTWNSVWIPISLDVPAAGQWTYTLNTLTDSIPDGEATISIKGIDSVSTAVALATNTYDYYIDNTVPSGTIDTPAAVPGTAPDQGQVIITGTATDNLGLAAVNGIVINITDGTTTLGATDITANYTNNQWYYNWTTDPYAGTATITVTLTDRAGKQTILPARNITLVANAPTTTITSPGNGAIVKATFDIEGVATDPGGVAIGVDKIEVKYNGGAYATIADPEPETTPYAWSYNSDLSSASYTDGPVEVWVRITDGDGVQSETKLTIELDKTAPVVTIISPTAAHIGNNFIYGIHAASGTVAEAHLSSIQVLVDDVSVGTPTAAASWTYNWDTRTNPGAKIGTEFKVRATDLAGNTGETSVTVDVKPKITAISTNTEFIGRNMTVTGYNFNNTLPNFGIVYTSGASSVKVTSGFIINNDPDGSQTITNVTIPAAATSGDMYVEECTIPIASNSIRINLWNIYAGNPVTDDGISGTDRAVEQDLVLDSANNAHYAINIGGGTKDLYFSHNTGPAILITTLNAQKPAIAVNDGYTYIAYVDFDGSDFEIVRSYNNDDFSTIKVFHEIDSDINKAGYTAIATYGLSSSAFKVGALYWDANNSLMFVESTENNGTLNTFTAGTPSIAASGIASTKFYCDLKYDSTGVPYLVFHDEVAKKIKFAYLAGASWQIRSVENNIFQGEYCSLKIGTANSIHISYYDAGSGDLKYAYAADKFASFTVSTVASLGITGVHTDITVDMTTNSPHISYLNSNFNDLRYAYKSGSTWYEVKAPALVGDAFGAVIFTRCPISLNSTNEVLIGYSSNSLNDAFIIKYLP